jgi:hypothetical protein
MIGLQKALVITGAGKAPERTGRARAKSENKQRRGASAGAERCFGRGTIADGQGRGTDTYVPGFWSWYGCKETFLTFMIEENSIVYCKRCSVRFPGRNWRWINGEESGKKVKGKKII